MKDHFSRRTRQYFLGRLLILAGLVPYGLIADDSQYNAWQSLGPAGTYVRVVRIDPLTPTTIYAGLVADDGHPFGGVYKSLDGGNTWAAMNNGLPNSPGIYALTMDPTNSSRSMWVSKTMALAGECTRAPMAATAGMRRVCRRALVFTP